MSVILLTVFIGLVLVSFFIFLFLHQSSSHGPNSERDALLPLQEEKISIGKPRGNRDAPSSTQP